MTMTEGDEVTVEDRIAGRRERLARGRRRARGDGGAVKTAMARIDGERKMTVEHGAHRATVIFDGRMTRDAAVAAASTHAGYPAARRG